MAAQFTDVSIIGINQQTFFISSLGEFEERDLELAKRIVANIKISDNLFKEICKKLESDGFVNTVWEIVSRQVTTAQEYLYGPLYTLNAREEDWPQTFDQIKKLGLHGMLGFDGKLTRAIAGIGLLNSFTWDIETITAFAPALDIDADALQRALQTNAVQGLPIIDKIDRSVLALV